MTMISSIVFVMDSMSFAERVAEMPPEKAAEICGIDVEDIYKAARMYANAKNATLLWGLATDQKSQRRSNGPCDLGAYGHYWKY